MNRNVFGAMWLLIFLLVAGYAWSHATDHPQANNYTHEEFVWMKRQRAMNGQWCCGPENVTLLEDPQLRVRRGVYEVNILNQWVPVTPDLMHRLNPDDPSPFGAEVLVFFSTSGDTIRIWCLTRPVGG